MCTFNGSDFIRRQLDSIFGQSVAVHEIRVFDDGSSDQTLDILAEYSMRFPDRLHITSNSSRLGTVKNFERAVSACRGDIIFLADHDDVWLPQKVE